MKPEDSELIAALASIAEGPGDEGRRRVLGDLLMERGDPRGEFLLLQFLIAENKGSGAIRQRADELWRSHKREWMAGAERVLCELKLDRGFPVEARLLNGVTPFEFTTALASPMLATLRRLDCARDGSAMIVEAVASPRFRGLREVSFGLHEHFVEATARGVPERLTHLRLGFELTSAHCDALLRSSVFARLSSLSARCAPGAGGLVERLSSHPTLRRMTITGEPFGDQLRFRELAPLWADVRFERITVPGSFELTREPEGTVVMLQNMMVQQLIGLRPFMPAGTTQVLLMPKQERHQIAQARAGLLAAYAGLNPRTLP